MHGPWISTCSVHPRPLAVQRHSQMCQENMHAAIMNNAMFILTVLLLRYIGLLLRISVCGWGHRTDEGGWNLETSLVYPPVNGMINCKNTWPKLAYLSSVPSWAKLRHTAWWKCGFSDDWKGSRLSVAVLSNHSGAALGHKVHQRVKITLL